MTAPVVPSLKPAHSRLTFSGTIGPGGTVLETWSTSINFTPDALIADWSDPQMDGLAGAMRTAWNAGINGVLANDCFTTEFRWALVGANQKVRTRPDGSYRQGISIVPSSGNGAVTSMPLQTACVASLVTARNGPTGKGRMFLPAPYFVPTVADKRWTPANVTSIADAVVATIAALNLIGAGKACVASSKGYTSEVTGVRVGRVPDAMRSRRRSQPEEYYSRPLTAQ